MKLLMNATKVNSSKSGKTRWTFWMVAATCLFDYIEIEKDELKSLIGDSTKHSFDNCRQTRHRDKFEFFTGDSNEETFNCFKEFCDCHKVDLSKYVKKDQFDGNAFMKDVFDYVDSLKKEVKKSA